jgi:hypothetical protein
MKIRINQIECRFSQGRYEIVRWQPNSYYNKQEEYLADGWERSGGFYRKGFTSVSEGCFGNPETCYTIATLHYVDGEGCCDMKTIGPRLLELDRTDREDFFAVYELAEDRIREEARNRETELNF